MATDTFNEYLDGLDSPAENSAAVTPSDSADLATMSRAIYVGVAGNLAVQLKSDTAPVTWSNVPAGSLLPIRARRVWNTNTTAGGIIALW